MRSYLNQFLMDPYVIDLPWPVRRLLVDNASSDGVPQAMARAHENDARLRVVYNHANLGFGPAMNRGVAQSHGKSLLILNPDCLIDTDTLTRLLQVLASNPRAGLVGAVVCDEDGTPDPASYRRDPLMRRALNTLFKRQGEGINIDGPIPHELVEAEAVSGALMLMPRRIFDFLGGFDEDYFLHCEDLDLCRRVRDAGYRVLLAGDVRVLHGMVGLLLECVPIGINILLACLFGRSLRAGHAPLVATMERTMALGAERQSSLIDWRSAPGT